MFPLVHSNITDFVNKPCNKFWSCNKIAALKD